MPLMLSAVWIVNRSKVSASAVIRFRRSRCNRADALRQALVLAAVNTLTAERAVRNLDELRPARARELHVLTTEPAIARVVAADENSKSQVVLHCTGNAEPTTARWQLSRQLLGRLAALPVGSEHQITTKSRHGGSSKCGSTQRCILG